MKVSAASLLMNEDACKLSTVSELVAVVAFPDNAPTNVAACTDALFVPPSESKWNLPTPLASSYLMKSLF